MRCACSPVITGAWWLVRRSRRGNGTGLAGSLICLLTSAATHQFNESGLGPDNRLGILPPVEKDRFLQFFQTERFLDDRLQRGYRIGPMLVRL